MHKFFSMFIIFLVIFFLYLNFNIFQDITNIQKLLKPQPEIQETNNKLRIALIYQENGDFTSRLTEGALNIAQKENISLKIYPVNPTGQLKLNDYLKLSLLANYDGIILDAEDPELIPLINRAFNQNIPIVTILSDLPDSKRISYVGIDNHRAGFIIGRILLNKMEDQELKLAIISSEYGNGDYTPAAEYLRIFGFKEAISSTNRKYQIIWLKSPPKLMHTLETISKLLQEHPEINGIFTTYPTATIAAANIISQKAKNRVTIIGYGNNQEIRNYIQEGIISTAVFVDPYEIGANAVQELKIYLQEKKVNLYSNIELQILTGGNSND